MFPIGTYNRLINKIKGREGKRADLIGVLFADIRQSDTKEYILNYMDSFNSNSGKYIDFYIPGYYEKEETTKGHESCYGFEDMPIGSKKFKFSQKEYDKAVNNFVADFNVRRRYTPVLYLIEWRNGDFSKARIVEINLDKDHHSVRKVGELFDSIFKIAKEGPKRFGNSKANSISNKLTVDELTEYFSNDFASDTGIPLVAIGVNIGSRLRRFKI